MSQLVTRCPHCSTSFHVNDQQLRAARGAVRCGSCLQVFRADENIVFNDSDPGTRSDLEALLEDDDFLIHDDIELEDDEPAEGKAQPHPPAQQLLSDAQISGEAAQSSPYTTAEASPESFIGDAFGDSEWQELQEETDSAGESEEDLASVLKPDWNDAPDFDSGAIETSDAKLTAPTDSHPDDKGPWEQPLGVQATESVPGSEPDATAAASSPSPLDSPEPLTVPSNGRQEPFFDSPGDADRQPQAKPEREPKPVREQLISAIQPAPLEVSWGRTTPKRSFSPWLWWLLLPLLSLALFAQVAYFQFDRLSKQQPWRNLYAVACPIFSCTLPQLKDPSAIQASNLMVRSHPQLDGALVVDAVLLNTAPYPQPFPNLLLNFSDLKNKAVASRRFTPREYLQGELAGRKLMPKGSPIHIAIEVVDPGTEAVNYEMKITP
ncbi:DUF3426 domain-containing protein [Microbulbifer echini]|uniref:DUF3426 domain-containing protein n=1 Tax=Microbulbifer echini TaxID=1529067 RepID=A0ABV4NPD6_9GAMM